jgi:hypothetical protein
MELKRTVDVICPMCKRVNKLTSEILKSHNAEHGVPFVYLCDNEQGGCDRYFVIVINLQYLLDTVAIDL